MVVAEEMEQPVGEIEVQLVVQGAPVCSGLPPRGVQRDDDVAEVPRARGARGGSPAES
jgi:hypothetical protein